jgi:hypothetical protein
VHFCIGDDDTNFFTSPEQLERAYGWCTPQTPISLGVIPFCRAGRSQCIPAQFRERWSVHALHDNPALVSYLRDGVACGRFEIMLHGYYHDVRDGLSEFARSEDFLQCVRDGRYYLEDLLGGEVRVFVPPHNEIRAAGLHAVARAGLHLAGMAGVRGGWPLSSAHTWRLWMRLRQWKRHRGVGIPWILDLGDHREIAGNPVSRSSNMQRNVAAFKNALKRDGVFCVTTRYWEFDSPSRNASTVGEQLQQLVALVAAHSRVQWQSVGETVTNPSLMI